MRSTQRKIQVLNFDTTENGTDLEDNYLTTSPTFNEETTIITGNLTLAMKRLHSGAKSAFNLFFIYLFLFLI